MERIAHLDNEVSQLKEENMNLIQIREQLKEERKKLKLQIASHVDNGCIIDGDESMWEVGKVDSTCK